MKFLIDLTLPSAFSGNLDSLFVEDGFEDELEIALTGIITRGGKLFRDQRRLKSRYWILRFFKR